MLLKEVLESVLISVSVGVGVDCVDVAKGVVVVVAKGVVVVVG